jgi:hypothetical protein
MKIIRAIAAAVLLSTAAAAAMSCGGSDTSPSASCPGSYTWDANVQRCRASNGQFAANACCGR